MDRRPPLRFPAQRKQRAPRKLKRATKDCGQCDNMLNRRMFVEVGDGRVEYEATLPTRCKHRGRPYKLNGLLTMTLCVCCITNLRKKATVTVRPVRKK